MRKWKSGPASSAVAMIILSAAVSAGCSPQGQGSVSSQDGQTNITVAALPSADLAGLYIAQDDGFFAAQGLHVRIERIASTQDVISGQLKGQVDIGAGSYLAYIERQAAGAKFRILAEASVLQPNTRVLVSSKNSPVSTVTGLAGHQIGVNGTNSIGTLLVDALLQKNGLSPTSVKFVTDPKGFPAMPADLTADSWGAAYLGEPYVTTAEENNGDRELVDLDQGSVQDFPVDGYIATQAWAQKNPGTAAAFDRAIQEGQQIAISNPLRARTAIAQADHLPGTLTAVMAMPGYPTGPVSEQRIQRTATDMLEFGMLSGKYRTVVDQGTLVSSMVGGAG